MGYERDWGKETEREGRSYGWRERDAVAREQQPHRGPLKTTAGLSN